MGFVIICLILSTNKTSAGGLLRRCSHTLWRVWTLMKAHTCAGLYIRTLFTKILLIFKKKKSRLSSSWINSNQKPHLHFFFLSSGLNHHLASRLHPWGRRFGSLFALEPFTVPSFFFCSHGRPPGGMKLNPPGVLCLHPPPLWWPLSLLHLWFMPPRAKGSSYTCDTWRWKQKKFCMFTVQLCLYWGMNTLFIGLFNRIH